MIIGNTKLYKLLTKLKNYFFYSSKPKLDDKLKRKLTNIFYDELEFIKKLKSKGYKF